MRRRERNWQVVVTFNGKVVNRWTGMTRLGARMSASGMNSSFARGARVVQRGGPFTAPVYERVPFYASASEVAPPSTP